MVLAVVQPVLNEIDFLPLRAREKVLVKLFKLRKKTRPLKEQGVEMKVCRKESKNGAYKADISESGSYTWPGARIMMGR